MKNNLMLMLLMSAMFLISAPDGKAQTSCGGKYVFGVTTESVENLEQLKNALRIFKGICIPTIRVVFQSGDEPGIYKTALEEIRGDNEVPELAYVMGLLVDSQAVYQYNKIATPRQPKDIVEQRANIYAKQLGKYVDIWEIGNEMNATWVGWDIEDKYADGKKKGREKYKERSASKLAEMRKTVGEQIAAVYNALKKHPQVKPTAQIALNLYFYKGCEAAQCFEELDNCQGDCINEYEMFQWSKNYLKVKERNLQFDYVLFSYYDEDCEGVATSALLWANIFSRLSDEFTVNGKIPKVGFGEVAPQCGCAKDANDNIDRRKQCCLDKQVPYIKNYYSELHDEIVGIIAGMKKNKPDYIGGFFYWYYHQDALGTDANLTVVRQAFIDAAKSWKK